MAMADSPEHQMIRERGCKLLAAFQQDNFSLLLSCCLERGLITADDYYELNDSYRSLTSHAARLVQLILKQVRLDRAYYYRFIEALEQDGNPYFREIIGILNSGEEVQSSSGTGLGESPPQEGDGSRTRAQGKLVDRLRDHYTKFSVLLDDHFRKVVENLKTESWSRMVLLLSNPDRDTKKAQESQHTATTHNKVEFKKSVANHECGHDLGFSQEHQCVKVAKIKKRKGNKKEMVKVYMCEQLKTKSAVGCHTKCEPDIVLQYCDKTCKKDDKVSKSPKISFGILRGLHSWQGIFLILLVSTQGGMASDVTLNSTLGATLLALPEDPVVFSCTTRGSHIVEWFSDEYIGTGGDGISLLSFNCLNSNVTSDAYPSTRATCVSVTTVDGVTVIESVLRIIAALERPIATVMCSNNGLGSSESITFQTFEPVVLTSTLDDGSVAYPGREIVFTCITRGSHIVEWFSDEYIGTGGDGISLLSFNCLNSNVTSDAYPSTRATCVNVTTESGVTVIESRLYITISAIQQTATVTCTNNGLGSRVDKTFHTAEQQFNGTTHAISFTTMTQTTVPLNATDDRKSVSAKIAVSLSVGIAATFGLIIIAMIAIIMMIQICKVSKGDVKRSLSRRVTSV